MGKNMIREDIRKYISPDNRGEQYALECLEKYWSDGQTEFDDLWIPGTDTYDQRLKLWSEKEDCVDLMSRILYKHGLLARWEEPKELSYLLHIYKDYDIHEIKVPEGYSPYEKDASCKEGKYRKIAEEIKEDRALKEEEAYRQKLLDMQVGFENSLTFGKELAAEYLKSYLNERKNSFVISERMHQRLIQCDYFLEKIALAACLDEMNNELNPEGLRAVYVSRDHDINGRYLDHYLDYIDIIELNDIRPSR